MGYVLAHLGVSAISCEFRRLENGRISFCTFISSRNSPELSMSRGELGSARELRAFLHGDVWSRGRLVPFFVLCVYDYCKRSFASSTRS